MCVTGKGEPAEQQNWQKRWNFGFNITQTLKALHITQLAMLEHV